ncbi:MAG: hypothetical protein ACRDO1_08910 [Nocardioidaceae bacterium]
MQGDESSTSDRPGALSALGALYGADRQDAATLVTARLALLALQMTYMGLVAIVLSGEPLAVGPWVAAFSAFPLWFLHSYHLLLVAISMARVTSVGTLEDKLYERSGLSPTERDLIGIRAGERMADIARQPLALKIQAVVSYGGIGAVMIAFSAYALVVAARGDGWGSTPVLLASVLYLSLFVASAAAWLRVAHLPRAGEG